MKQKQIKLLAGLVLLIVGISSLIAIYLYNYTPVIPQITGTPEYELTHFKDKATLKTEIDYLNMQIHEGKGFQSWSFTDLTYEHADMIMAQLMMYEESKDIKYLTLARSNLYWLYNQAGSCTDASKVWNGYTSMIKADLKTWRCKYSQPVDHLQEGKLYQLFAKYVQIVKDNNIIEHEADAVKFEHFVSYDRYNEMKDTFQEYTVTLEDGSTEKRACYGAKTYAGLIDCNNNNRVSADVDILVYLYKWTGDVKYKTMYEEWGRYFKNSIFVKADTPYKEPYYAWNYNNQDPLAVQQGKMVNKCSDPNAWTCGRSDRINAEMGKYTSFDIVPILHGYREGLFWTKYDMTLFTNTFTKAAAIYRGNTYINGALYKTNVPLIGDYTQVAEKTSEVNKFSTTPKAFGWVDFAQFDKKVFDIQEEIIYNEYYLAKSKNDFWGANTDYKCVANIAVDADKPICVSQCEYGQCDNPADRMYSMVLLYKYAKE